MPTPTTSPDVFVWVGFAAGVVYLCEFAAVRVISPLRSRWKPRQPVPPRVWSIARLSATICLAGGIGIGLIGIQNVRATLASVMAMAFITGNVADFVDWRGLSMRGRSRAIGLSILRATYGAGEKWVDVKGLILREIKAGRIAMDVTNDTMGGDPIYGLVKALKITYTVGTDQPKTVEVPEGGQLSIP
jgi:hypothetical protein